jgi:hypothetical protein
MLALSPLSIGQTPNDARIFRKMDRKSGWTKDEPAPFLRLIPSGEISGCDQAGVRHGTFDKEDDFQYLSRDHDTGRGRAVLQILPLTPAEKRRPDGAGFVRTKLS